MPTNLDFSELRRGLYHFYHCDRGYPERLQDFVAMYGDYRTWSTAFIESSRPKVHPRRIWQNDDVGVYVAETIEDGEVSEIEIILSNHRADGALDFLAYLPNGQLVSRGKFKTGSEPVFGPSPYTCLACHYDANAETYHIFPSP